MDKFWTFDVFKKCHCVFTSQRKFYVSMIPDYRTQSFIFCSNLQSVAGFIPKKMLSWILTFVQCCSVSTKDIKSPLHAKTSKILKFRLSSARCALMLTIEIFLWYSARAPRTILWTFLGLSYIHKHNEARKKRRKIDFLKKTRCDALGTV